MPAAYRRKAGNVMTAQLLDYALHSGKKKGKLSPAQKAGLAYEKKVLAHLLLDLDDCQFHPALKFSSRQGFYEYCIPDAIAWNDRRDILTVIEIKSRHTRDAWMQLNNLYLPVVRAIWPQKHINLLEICRDYEPGNVLPGASVLVEDVSMWIEKAQQKYGVLPWSGR